MSTLKTPANQSMVRKDIRQAISDAMNGRGPYVFGMDVKGEWHRITRLEVKRGLEYGLSLSSGKLFVMYRWETRP